MSFFLSTEKTGLRPISLSDSGEEYLSWMNDSEVTKGLESGAFPTTKEALDDFLKSVTVSKNNVMLAIIDRESGKHIGNIKLGNINWVHRHAELGILIGNKNFWGKGHGTEACRLVVEYAFSTLNLHKVWLAVFSNNPGAYHIYKKLGFVEEGRLRDHVFADGQYFDKILMSVFNPSDK
ncbi:MAG: GNAT family protein [Bacteroidia bacterium]